MGCKVVIDSDIRVIDFSTSVEMDFRIRMVFLDSADASLGMTVFITLYIRKLIIL